MSPPPRSDVIAAQRVVIIGAGHGGVEVVDALRLGGHTGPITLVGDEAALPYQRPPLSKEHLTAAHPEPLPLRGERFFTEHHVDLRTGITATSIDRRSRAVSLSDGGELPYDALVLACGATNRVLPVPGSNLAGIHALRTLTDAEALRAAMTSSRSALVVGAGFIGLEYAAAARQHGLAVTVLEAAPRPLSRALSPQMADHIADAHRRTGTDLRVSEGLARFVGKDGRVTGAVSTTGARYEADQVLVGIGVAPRVELAAQAGLAVEDGIVVDSNLRTSDPAVYAVGDCANHPDVRTGTRLRLESVQNATDQARHVATAILSTDGDAPGGYADLPWFWSYQGDLRLQIAGLRLPDDRSLLLGDPAAGRFSVCCFREGRLVAVESLNRPADHMAARRLIANGRSPDPEQLSDPGFTLKAFNRTFAPTS